jgi:wyosine [tRNA(Phe)-imidazoG37] synthetase (radical SAM superfamily)
MRIEREEYYQPEQLVQEVERKIADIQKEKQRIDYLTFVPDGEPTLDIHLGKEIELLRLLDIPIAVITNSSLIWREDVQEDLVKADWVSVKIDAVTEEVWRKINRPHHSLRLNDILTGIHNFAGKFNGELATETMLVKEINYNSAELEKISEYIKLIKPAVSYISIPTRPPAEQIAVAPAEGKINQAYHAFKEKISNVELLIGYEGNAFAFTGNVEDDLLSITAVHPMRADAVDEFLKRSGSNWSVVHRMLEKQELLEAEFEGNKFYLRKLDRRHRTGDESID